MTEVLGIRAVLHDAEVFRWIVLDIAIVFLKHGRFHPNHFFLAVTQHNDLHSVVADVVVNRRTTKLLQDAHARGCFTQPGVHMMDGQIAPMAAFLGLGEGAWDADAVARATGNA